MTGRADRPLGRLIPAGMLVSDHQALPSPMSVPGLARIVGLILALVVVLTAQAGRPPGVAGLPVEGHEVIGAGQVRGSKRFDMKRLEARLPQEGVLIRLGRPLDETSICRMRETIKDRMTEQGFPNTVAHELLPYRPDRQHNAVRLEFTITEGKRASRGEWTTAAPLPPAARCEG